MRYIAVAVAAAIAFAPAPIPAHSAPQKLPAITSEGLLKWIGDYRYKPEPMRPAGDHPRAQPKRLVQGAG